MQGDPIVALLFVMAMDVLSKMFDKRAINWVFRLYPECGAPLVTHFELC